MRRKIERITLLLLYCWISCCNYYSCEAQTQQSRSCGPPVSTENYGEWESWNYYEILGLEEAKGKPNSKNSKKLQKKRQAIELKDVKKAYRKQAQQWHPDKVVSLKKNITVAESNARFARIAEAYKVLNNDDTRRQYDDFLVSCEVNQQQQSQSQASNRWWEQFSTDPRSVFQDFFFGTSDDDAPGAAPWEKEFFRDSTDPYSSFASSSSNHKYNRKGNHKTGYRQSRQPLGVYESREMFYDEYSGEELLRVFQKEEFLEPDGRIYYRIIAQEFAQVYNVYSGATLQAVAQPYVLEEGHRNGEPSHQHQQQQQQQQNGYSYSRGPETERSPSTLYEADILTPESKFLESPNKRYYAGLSSDCELLVMSENSLKDDGLVWTSDSFVPRGGCFATLNGSHLIIGMGPPSRPRNIIWYSDVYTSGDEEEIDPIPPTFMAQLDNDGSLAVYRVVTLPSPFQMPTTRAAKAYMVTRQYIVGTLLGQSFPSPTTITYKTCIYATGPMGCNRLGRRLLQLASDTSYLVKYGFAKLDHLFDTWMERLLEEEDIVGVLIEALHRGMEYCKQHGTILARTGIRVVRDMFRQATTKAGSK
jgi:curved DNA-binding protein CbpA